MTAHPPKNDAGPIQAPGVAPIVLLGGRRVSPEAAVVSVFDAGFALGDGLFETMLARRGAIFGVSAHIDRLERSAAAVGLDLPPSALLLAELHEALTLSQRTHRGEVVLRLQVTAGVGGGSTTRVVTARPLNGQERARRHGLDLFSVGPGRSPEGGAGGHKSSSWGVSAAARRTHAEGARPSFEGLFTTAGGEVLEGTTTSIGVVRAGHLRFPQLDGRILDGVTRRRAAAAATALGLEVVEGPILLGDLPQADAVLALNALLPAAACVTLDGQPLPDGSALAAAISHRLMNA